MNRINILLIYKVKRI